MGWTSSYNWKSKKETIDAYLGEFTTTTVVKRYGDTGFVLCKNKDGVPFGLVLLVRSFGKNNGFGYKDMDTSECPYYYHPKMAKDLKNELSVYMASHPEFKIDDNTQTWIETSLNANAEKKLMKERLSKLVRGQKIWIKDCYTINGEMTFWELLGRSKLVFRDSGSHYYRMKVDGIDWDKTVVG